MNNLVKLKDGTEVLIRPMTADDLDRSVAFFKSLPEEDRAYLRADTSKVAVVERRIRVMEAGSVRRLVAILDDNIVADGALELQGPGWKEHVGELRLIVARPNQRKGLGMLMARELYRLAAAEKVKEIVVEMMRPQVAAQSIFRKLGFREGGVLPGHVRDLKGKKHDLVVMRCDMEALWQELEDYVGGMDWQRTR
jgi:L-amino acid N-acyltransferase YncA